MIGGMKWIDIPPVWLLGFAVLAWLFRWVWTAGSPVLRMAGTALVVVGLVLMLVAVIQMLRHRTTPVPHQEASHLVTDGIFALSRNPIYLGDLLVLAGLALRWESPLGLLLVPGLLVVLQGRFILAEEARLRRAFGEAFTAYAEQTRRWL